MYKTPQKLFASTRDDESTPLSMSNTASQINNCHLNFSQFIIQYCTEDLTLEMTSQQAKNAVMKSCVCLA